MLLVLDVPDALERAATVHIVTGVMFDALAVEPTTPAAGNGMPTLAALADEMLRASPYPRGRSVGAV